SVQLQLYGLISGGSTSTTEVQTNLYATAANWSEFSVTWNTQPATGSLLGSLTATRIGQWFTLDVTDSVRPALPAGQASADFELHNPVSTSPLSDFTANEAATNQPRFVVTPLAGAGPSAAGRGTASGAPDQLGGQPDRRAGTALTAGVL